MFIETKTFTVKEGTSNIVVERFTGEGIIEKFEGFIDLSVLVKKVRRGDEEVSYDSLGIGRSMEELGNE